MFKVLLTVVEANKNFGGIKAVDRCSFSIKEGEILGIIGPNGSGKTTLFNLITGILKMASGQILYKGKRIDGLKTNKIAMLGIGRTFQIVRIFKNISVFENMLTAMINSPSKLNLKEKETSAIEMLKYIGLEDLKDEYAKNLSYGQQKLLEFAIILLFDPQLILLDEPCSGVNPAMIKKMMFYITDLNKRKHKTFIIIEHNIRFIMEICNRVIVLNNGQKIADGLPEEVKRDEEVIKAYLG